MSTTNHLTRGVLVLVHVLVMDLKLSSDATVAPVAIPPRRVPLVLKSTLKDEVDGLEALGVITKVN